MHISNTLQDYLNCYKDLFSEYHIEKFCITTSQYLVKQHHFEDLKSMGDFLKGAMPPEEFKELGKITDVLFKEPKEECLPIIGYIAPAQYQKIIDEMISEETNAWYAPTGVGTKSMFLHADDSQNVYQSDIAEDVYDNFYDNMKLNLLLHVANGECGFSIHIGHSEL